MPKKYERKTTKASWSEDAMLSAIAAVIEGNQIRMTCRKYGVPYSTLRDRLKIGNYYAPRLGRKAIFNAEQEQEIATQLLSLSRMFYGLTPLQLRKAAFEFAEANNISNNFNKNSKMAGKDWLYSFMARNPELSFRKPEPTSLNRITAFNKVEVSHFFENLGKLMTQFQFGPTKVYNMDETGITAVHKPAKIVGPKGQKQVGSITSLERGKTITVCCAMSAGGSYVPPMFIYPRLRMAPSLERNGPPGTIYRCSKNGWINEELFREWLQHFLDFTKASKEDPVLLVVDNHSSHTSLDIYHFCRNHGIVMLSIPPHSSHRLQPLDLTFFSPLKKAFSMECELFLKNNPYIRITNSDIPGLFTNAYLKVAVAEKAVNGFKAAGIFPMNPSVFDELDFAIEQSSSDLRETELETIKDLQNNQVPTTGFLKEGNNTTDQRNVELQPSCSGLGNKNRIEKIQLNVSFSQISPKPLLPASFKKSNLGRKKQKSKILTSTPIKSELEELEQRRKKKLEATKVENRKGKRKTNIVSKPTKRQVFQSSSDEEDVELSNIVDDDECDDVEMSDNEIAGMERRTAENDICIICQEYGKNEVWYRCTVCGKWAHAFCTGAERPHGYVCDYCK